MKCCNQALVLGLTAALIAERPDTAAARLLNVGPGQTYEVPSAAAAVAQDGDFITIAPATYYDCALWHASRLIIAGAGPGVVISDRACAGKAAFVISGSMVLVRDLVFTRIRVPDGNGAGIRAEGADLTVESSQFVNNQIGILAGAVGGNLYIVRCTFIANGVSLDGRQTHSVSSDRLARLRIEHSIFEKARGGDHIVSAALDTELTDNKLIDEGSVMTGPLVSIYRGGKIVLVDNTVELAADATDRPGAVLVTGEASQILVVGNTLIEPHGNVPLVLNWTGLTASESTNTVPVDTVAVSNSGLAYHLLRAHVARFLKKIHAFMGTTRHLLAEFARRLHGFA